MSEKEVLTWIEQQGQHFRITEVNSIELGKGFTVTGKETVGFGSSLVKAVQAAIQNSIR